MACPHSDIRFCPLYHAAHIGSRHGCDDGELGSGSCATSRGMNYASTVAALQIEEPRLVAELIFAEEAQASREQRNRNMRLLRIN